MRVDAHHHLWHYRAEEFEWIDDRSAALRRDFLTQDLEAALHTAHIDAAIAVQARCSLDETQFLLSCARQSPAIRAVVGWVPLAAPDLPAILDALANETQLAGFREIAQDQPAGFLLAAAFNDGIQQLTARGYTYDILIRAHQLDEATRFVDLHPHQRFVLDHAAKPAIARAEIEPWRSSLRALAERPNVFCKLSGLVTEAAWDSWTGAELTPYLDTCLEAFGPARLMAASDWPVCLVASSYERWWQTLEAWAGRLSPTEKTQILGATAASFYNLKPAAGMES